MNKLLIKLATGLRCFYDTLILVDHEKDKLNKEIEELKREIRLQQMVMTFGIMQYEYLIVKKYAVYFSDSYFDRVSILHAYCCNVDYLPRYGIPKEHCTNRESILKYCEDFLK